MDDRRCAMCLTERNARIVSKPTDEMHPVYACNECVEYSIESVFLHVKRDPLVCPGRDKHEFVGFREFEDGRGGETVCKHCGVGAMEHTMALDT